MDSLAWYCLLKRVAASRPARPTLILAVGALAGLLAAGASQAAGPQVPQTANPGSIFNQQLQNLRKHPFGPEPGPGSLPPVLTAPKHKAKAPRLVPGVHFVLKGVRINQSAFLTPGELAALYRPYLDKTVYFSDLHKIVEKIDALYRSKGVVTARAVLPPQRIVKGVVRIELVEGKVGKVTIEGNSITRSSYIRRRVRAAPGQVVDAKKLEDQLIFFNRTNRTQLHASLKPGASFGLTNILLRAHEPARAGIDLFADNEGVKATGANEIGAFLRDNAILGLGDSLELYAVKSSGSTTGNVLYNIPVNVRGGTLGLSYARGRINVVSGPGEPLGITGTSSTAGVSFVQPVLVNERWKLAGAFELARDTSETELSGQSLGTTYVDKASAGVRAEYFAPRRYARFTLSVTPERAHGSGATTGSVRVYDGTVSLVQRLAKPLAPYSIVLKSAWQYADQPSIAAAELFSIGGASSVRGYTQGLLSGARGYYAQLELHRRFAHKVDGFVFTDTGSVYNASAPRQVITGVGAGLSWHWRALTTSLSVGHPVNQTTPEQSSYRANLRVALHFPIR